MCSGLTRVRSGWMTLAAWSTETRSVPPRRGAWADASRDKPDRAGNPAAEARTVRRVGCLILSLLCLRLPGPTGHFPAKSMQVADYCEMAPGHGNHAGSLG